MPSPCMKIISHTPWITLSKFNQNESYHCHLALCRRHQERNKKIIIWSKDLVIQYIQVGRAFGTSCSQIETWSMNSMNMNSHGKFLSICLVKSRWWLFFWPYGVYVSCWYAPLMKNTTESFQQGAFYQLKFDFKTKSTLKAIHHQL